MQKNIPIFRYTYLDGIMAGLVLLFALLSVFLEIFHNIYFYKIILFIFPFMMLLRIIAQNSQHYHAHIPFFNYLWLNRAFDILISVVYSSPQTGYARRHFVHHRTTIEYNFSTFEALKDIVFFPFVESIDILRFSYLYAIVRYSPFIKSLFFKAKNDNENFNEKVDILNFKNITEYRKYLLSFVIKEAEQKIKVYELICIEYFFILFYRTCLIYINPSFFFAFIVPVEYISNVLMNWWEYNQHLNIADQYDSSKNSVSCYGKIYNFLFFNDGFHQEHHYKMSLHWTRLPQVTSNLPLHNERSVVNGSFFTGSIIKYFNVT